VVSDVLGPDKKLTTARPKLHWQPGWLKQHDRLMAAMSEMKAARRWSSARHAPRSRSPRCTASGSLDLKRNPVNVALSGTTGTWPGAGRRAAFAARPRRLRRFSICRSRSSDEQHGFTLIDFTPDKMVLRMFRWDVNTQPSRRSITLEPFHVAELPRPT